ncbi:ester cyclase [Nonomuraea sp. NPDC049480]|uniref:ester cyclase n=1 Tax=Nonomuraea sp. NPDC049480 TaxID=3364353 RepID=UPI00379DDB7E
MAPSSERKQRLLKAWAAAWDHGDVDALDSLLSPRYRRRTRSSIEGQTREELKALILTSRMAFPNLTTVVEEIVEEGDRLAVRWRSSGTHTGFFMGVPPTKKPVTVAGATFALFDGDMIVEEWVTWDARELLSALGVLTVGEQR